MLIQYRLMYQYQLWHKPTPEHTFGLLSARAVEQRTVRSATGRERWQARGKKIVSTQNAGNAIYGTKSLQKLINTWHLIFLPTLERREVSSRHANKLCEELAKLQTLNIG
jgi:hypothetical protein